MCKEAPAARARGPRDQDISLGRLAWKSIRPQSEGQLGSTNLAVIFRRKYCRTHRHDANNRERSKGEPPVQRRHRSEEGASREPQPGNPREPGFREVAVEVTRNKGQVNAKLHCVFLSEKS